MPNQLLLVSHSGVKGMKWGVRKDDSVSGGKKGGLTPVSKMTDAELQSAVNRMNLEKSYKKLMAEERAANMSSVQRGGITVAKMLGKAGKIAIEGYLSKQISSLLVSAIKK